eukprot:29952-Pelagococcus_subviridis.AAC.6
MYSTSSPSRRGARSSPMRRSRGGAHRFVLVDALDVRRGLLNLRDLLRRGSLLLPLALLFDLVVELLEELLRRGRDQHAEEARVLDVLRLDADLLRARFERPERLRGELNVAQGFERVAEARVVRGRQLLRGRRVRVLGDLRRLVQRVLFRADGGVERAEGGADERFLEGREGGREGARGFERSVQTTGRGV